MIPNLLVKSDGSVVQKTHIARTHDEDNRYELIALPETETKLSLLGNLFLCNGKIYECLTLPTLTLFHDLFL